MGIELQILHMMQGLHQTWLDAVMIFFTTLGDGGFIWIALSVVLIVIPRTRKCGLGMLLALAINFLLGNLIIKNIIARPRPFIVDTSVTLLIPKPSEFSFPSGHTSSSFAAATVLFAHYRKPGAVALLVAGVIAFSRMYLFVHYPTDILGGMLLGTMNAMLVLWYMRRAESGETA